MNCDSLFRNESSGNVNFLHYEKRTLRRGNALPYRLILFDRFAIATRKPVIFSPVQIAKGETISPNKAIRLNFLIATSTITELWEHRAIAVPANKKGFQNWKPLAIRLEMALDGALRRLRRLIGNSGQKWLEIILF